MKRPPVLIDLALQGGGAHGAFTWGVLDQLLQDERIRIMAVSGTSAGAMNAVALADGMARGGPAEARKCPERFWLAISERLARPDTDRAAVATQLTDLEVAPLRSCLVF